MRQINKKVTLKNNDNGINFNENIYFLDCFFTYAQNKKKTVLGIQLSLHFKYMFFF